MSVRMKFRSLMAAVFATGLVFSSISMAAEEGTVAVMAPWEGSGQVFQVAPDKLMVYSRYTGIMYIKDKKGALDTAVMLCPGVDEINVETKRTKGRGHCIISDGEDSLVFSEWTCVGTLGGCEGDFKITGGTGEFEGISGGGKMQVRTALVDAAIDLSSGSVIKDAAGLAVWPELTYKIPGN